MQDKETIYARWLNGELSEQELEALRKEGVITDLERIVQTTDQWAMPTYDPEQGFEKYQRKYPLSKAPVRTINWKWISGIAASLALLITVWVYVINNRGEVVAAKPGMNEMAELIDGTKILVNDGSEIKYNEDDWQHERKVSLRGEAYFEVESGSGFQVITENGSVLVLGTRFNVRGWGNNLYVECYEGRVQVTSGDQQQVLQIGESVNVVSGVMGNILPIENKSPLWQNGSSRFFEEEIGVVFEEVERQFNVTIQAPLINRSFSGIFEHSELENALQNICKPFGLTFKISEDRKQVFIE